VAGEAAAGLAVVDDAGGAAVVVELSIEVVGAGAVVVDDSAPAAEVSPRSGSSSPPQPVITSRAASPAILVFPMTAERSGGGATGRALLRSESRRLEA
jgi:hypothetical protein